MVYPLLPYNEDNDIQQDNPCDADTQKIQTGIQQGEDNIGQKYSQQSHAHIVSGAHEFVMKMCLVGMERMLSSENTTTGYTCEVEGGNK